MYISFKLVLEGPKHTAGSCRECTALGGLVLQIASAYFWLPEWRWDCPGPISKGCLCKQ